MAPVLVLLGGFCVVGFLIVMFFVTIYNKLVQFRNRYENAFAQIDVQLKRRYDLIPNLVETAKGYMKHEKETLEAVITARNQAYTAGQKAAGSPGDPQAMGALNQAESQLGGALSRLMVISEAYPDLKASQNMMSLQEELSSTENKVAFSRQAFNDSVTGYNIYREQIPAVWVAGTFGFREAELFEIADQSQREAPKIEF
ncbi:MAG: LemA family protein [Pirellulaceae bacterium]|nr:LemA family protein [Pirellulaceae bacterium]